MSSTLLCVFLLLSICIGIVTATERETRTENTKDLFATSSILWWRHPPQWWWHHHHVPSIGWWWHPHPKKPSPPTQVDVTPSPSPVEKAASPTHAAPSPSLVANVASPTHASPSPSPVAHAASPTHAAPSPSLVANAASPTHASPSPSPVAHAASPTHAAPSPYPSPVDNADSSPPSWAPAMAPTASCLKVDGCALYLITSIFKRKISLSTQCCRVLSTISDECFYIEFAHSKRVPYFLEKVRNYCSHHQG